jgi:hypothetical protein
LFLVKFAARAIIASLVYARQLKASTGLMHPANTRQTARRPSFVGQGCYRTARLGSKPGIPERVVYFSDSGSQSCDQDVRESLGPKGKLDSQPARPNVRFGSQADILGVCAISAIPPKADITTHSALVRYGPIADVTSPLITHRPCAGVGQRARRELAVELVVNRREPS